MYPHGGPEARDTLAFDPWAQYFVSLGYAVFQPNFRGSDGFGRAFAESGYGEWGRKMQDDISDGLKSLVEQGCGRSGRASASSVPRMAATRRWRARRSPPASTNVQCPSRASPTSRNS